MSTRLAIGRVPKRVIATVIAIATIWCGYSLAFGDGTKHGVAYFSSVTSVYAHDKVRILGVEVGRIDKISPEAGRVRVEFSYDGSYDLPEDVNAAVVSPTLVATRFLQLEPAYSGGPKFADDGTIPETRTASPLEFDDLKSELSRVSNELGPNASDANGALASFLDVAAKNGKGQGERFNAMVTQLSQSLRTLAEGRGDIFGTVQNLQVFVSAIKGLDGQVGMFNTRLADVSDLLDDNGDDLAAAIRSVDGAAGLVHTFIDSNRAELRGATTKLADLTAALASSRDDIATLLHAGPNTLTNFYNIFSPRMHAFTGGLMVDNVATPGELICTLIAQQTGAPQNDLTGCGKYLAPLLNQFGISQPPIGTNGGVVIPGGGGPASEVPPAESGQTDHPSSQFPPSVGSSGLLGLLMPGGQR